MNKILFAFALLTLFCFVQQPIHAAPPQEDVDQILTELGWTQQQLVDYLNYYELTLDEFETIEDLRNMLGTPITDENLAELLNQYGISRQEMDTALAEFYNETLDDYFFIEDLDIALSFALGHDEEMSEIEAFMSIIGLTDEEIEALFNHLREIDETKLEQQMEAIVTRLDPYLMMEDMTKLTEAQEDELISILQDMMNTLQLKAIFTLIDNGEVETSVTFKELMNMEELYNNDLLISLYNTSGELLLDMRLSENMLSSEFAIQSGIEFAKLGDLAGKLTNLYHNRLPDTATSLWSNMLLGLVVLGLGLLGFFFSRRFQQVK